MTVFADTAIPRLGWDPAFLPAAVTRAPYLNLFAGPGGWDEGARILGVDVPMLGVDIDPDACQTGRAAGFPRECGDVTAYDPAGFGHVTGLVISSPCQTFTIGGTRSGLGLDYQRVLDVLTHHGASVATWDEDLNDYVPGCDCTPGEIEAETASIADVRTRLAAQSLRWALHLPNLEWLAMEQVPAAEYMFEDVAAELSAAGWESVDVVVLDAADYGVATRRRRVYLVGRRYTPLAETVYPGVPFVRTSVAEALGWESGHRINTRGERRTSGGNVFSADQTGWCLTQSARTWERVADRLRFTAAEAGTLNSFPAHFPWRGSRTSQFQQIADCVAPVMAAVVLGTALGIDWRGPVRAHLDALYGGRR